VLDDETIGGYDVETVLHGAGLDHPSVWCRDLLGIFGRLLHLLGVDHRETVVRRQALAAPAGRAAV
jgi:hypothetical protein